MKRQEEPRNELTPFGKGVIFFLLFTLFIAAVFSAGMWRERQEAQAQVDERERTKVVRANPEETLSFWSRRGYECRHRTYPRQTDGRASYYTEASSPNRRTASGEVFDEDALTAAHRVLPYGTVVRVKAKNTDETIEVRINDYGPSSDYPDRIIDLSKGAMKRLGGVRKGVLPVTVTILSLGEGCKE